MTCKKNRAIILERGDFLRIAVCDDDVIYANEIEKNVEIILCEHQINANFSMFTNSAELYNHTDSFDLAFLDIEMEPYNGIETARRLKQLNEDIIVFFITSYDKYLDDAMDLNAFRFINKPLDNKRLKRGIEKAIKLIDTNQIQFYLKNGKDTVSIFSNSIIYVEIVGHSTKVVTTDNVYYSDESISFWNKKLIASFFYAVHKSFIVNMKFITNYKRDTITLDNKYEIPIAYRKQASFRGYFLNYFGGC